MKITFSQQTITETEQKQIERRRTESASGNLAAATAGAFWATFDRGSADIMPGQGGEKGKSLIELQQEAANTNVAVSQDYMTLAANTMSAEDYARMQEEGFDFGTLDPEEAVTIVDKIKAELVRAGEHIAGYTDDLDMDTLSAALGSETLAKAVTDSFRAADLPMTEENVAAISSAWTMASQLSPLTEGAYEYLIDNGMEGEIWNLYLAQNSGAGKGGNMPKFFAENVQGYYTQSAGGATESGMPAEGQLAEQIDRIIEQSGNPVNEESRRNAHWLLQKGLPLTGENLNRLSKLQGIALPVTEERFAEAVAGAIVSGKKSVYASLDGEHANVYEKAVASHAYYQSESAWTETGAAVNLTARRQLEEIRLRMTAEVNVKLLKSGFAIDTAPMEALVEALKQAEAQLAEKYFPGDENATAKYEIYRDTNLAVEQLPGMPADILGVFAKGQKEIPFAELYGEGVASRERYVQANERYEALMTAPRRDLGDSIKKAFANVDDILRDLGVETTEENRRAVRILGYNRMEMTLTNMRAVSAADRQVQHVIEKLTPAATLKMIRDGMNPLEKSFEELEQYFETLPEDYKKESESYSRFLYGLERNSEITPEERDSFIGIYRLVHQIEKADGAVVGALVNSQAELHFSNLLSAVRSGKVKSLDVRVSDELGAIAEVVRRGDSISEQIGRAFVNAVTDIVTDVSYEKEATEDYRREELQTMRETILAADAECVALLQRGQLPSGADNLMAAQALLYNHRNLFKPEAATGTGLWQQLDNKTIFTRHYENRLQEELIAVEAATFEQADSLDVRHMQLTHKQLTVATSLAKQEEFFLPMYVGDTLAKVHLAFDRAGREKGSVDIRVFLTEETTIHARLRLDGDTVHGVFAGESMEEVMDLQKIADIFKESAKENWTPGNITVELAGGRVSRVPEGDAPEKANNEELYRVAKVFLQSVKQGEEIYEN